MKLKKFVVSNQYAIAVFISVVAATIINLIFQQENKHVRKNGRVFELDLLQDRTNQELSFQSYHGILVKGGKDLMTSKNFRHLITVTSKEIKLEGVTLKNEDDVIALMGDLNAAKSTMLEMRRTEQKLQHLKDSFNGKSAPVSDNV